MAAFKCKMCGGMLEVEEGKSIATCDYCGSEQTVGTRRDETVVNMYNRATNIRMKNDFDKAQEIYEKILDEDDTDAEAHWGVVLCKYGIEYVEDPKTHNRIPTCHRTLVESVTTDVDYLAAIQYGDVFQRKKYEEEAKKIAELQNEILNISSNEKPFDVFICYKEKDENGGRTQDSVLANDIYYQLTQAGLRVFYAAVTLEDKLGTEYEPYIYAALHSARVMLVVGTKPEYFGAVWVKNEWSRYLAIMKNDRSRTLIPCFRDMDAYDLPEEFAHLQAQDMNKIGFINDIVRGIRKLTASAQNEKPGLAQATDTKSGASEGAVGANTTSLLKRVSIFLEDRDWKSANEYCEKVLDIDPECAEAYLGKLMADMKISKEERLQELKETFDQNKNYQKIIKFGSAELGERIKRYNDSIIAAKTKKEQDLLALIIKNSVNAARIPVAIGEEHVVGLRSDGTVIAIGNNKYDECNVSGWRDIIAISAGDGFTIGLKLDGTVVAAGDTWNIKEISEWRDIVAISARDNRAFGLKSDGTVVAAGCDINDECNGVSEWKNIVSISAGFEHVAGLKSDGTVVAIGDNADGQCVVGDWRYIIALSTDSYRTDGVTLDRTPVSTNEHVRRYMLGWKDITAISSSVWGYVGLKSDGTVVSTIYDECVQRDVSGWRDIVAVAAGETSFIGLNSKGKLVVAGSEKKIPSLSSITSWNNIMPISNAQTFEEDLKEKESIIRKNFIKLEGVRREEEELRLREKEQEQRDRLVAQRRSQGVCQYCGGTFKGLFSKKCSSCGKPKDY